ncbi:MAG: response regulator [Oscillospiraceae bacterium]|jgi:putative two-component system response regulator|nr:response regulator [Oscillospiraceae bacterium]
MSERKKIIFVDDQISNLMIGRNVLSTAYDVFTVPSADKLFKLLEKVEPDLILLDVEMPDMNGYETIKKLKSETDTARIPVVFLTARNDTGSELEGLSLGAIDYISKPFSPPLLLKRIEVHMLVEEQKRQLEYQKKELQNLNDNLEEMVEEKTKTIVELQNAVLETVAELVECRDDITGGHIERTQSYLKILLEGLRERNIYSDETKDWDIDLLIQSAQLHDVGKISISDNILCKPGKLTPEEFEEMKNHTLFGGKVIERIQERTTSQAFLNYTKTMAISHHEKWDGTGYPHGLRGSDIPLEGRLMAIVDVYDALVSERPYKKPFSHEEAVRIIKEGSGTQFEPTLVDLFLDEEEKFRKTAESKNMALTGTGVAG